MPRRRLAWDAGCGNGQASVALAGYFGEVYATDPSEAQIAQAQPHERVQYAVESAEDCSLGDHTANLVTVAQAYHWFDHERFCNEARRVLANDGVIAMWSYAESMVSADVDLVVAELHHGTLEQDWPAERRHVLDRYRDLPFPFRAISAPPFEMRSEWNLHQYLAYLSSWSASQRYLKRTGEDPVAAAAPAMRRPGAIRNRCARWNGRSCCWSAGAELLRARPGRSRARIGGFRNQCVDAPAGLRARVVFLAAAFFAGALAAPSPRMLRAATCLGFAPPLAAASRSFLRLRATATATPRPASATAPAATATGFFLAAASATLPPRRATATAAPTDTASFNLPASLPAFGTALTRLVPTLLSAILSTAAEPASRTSVRPVFNNFSVCEFMAMSTPVGLHGAVADLQTSAKRMNAL
jgi:SAM-dependent methyltransferase